MAQGLFSLNKIKIEGVIWRFFGAAFFVAFFQLFGISEQLTV